MARWAGVIVAVVILVLGQRLTTLQNIKKLPRAITSQQRSAFIAESKLFKKGKVSVIFNPQSNEGHDYASKISEMLDSAGFDTGGTVSQGIGGKPRVGIVLVVGDRTHPPEHLETISTTLRQIGIESEIEDDEHVKQYSPDVVEVIVGKQQD